MKTNQLTILVVIAALAFGLGYGIRGNQDPQGYVMSSSMMGNHKMGGTSMENMINGMIMGLQGKTGDEFDKAFLSEMIVHHEGAVAMAQAVLKNSKHPELIQLANNIIFAQTAEINQMKTWYKEWFNQ